MHNESLVRMANDIGAFFATESAPEERAQSVLAHIKRYWDPRMRTQIVQYYRSDGTGLASQVADHVFAAIALLAQEHQPKPPIEPVR